MFVGADGAGLDVGSWPHGGGHGRATRKSVTADDGGGSAHRADGSSDAFFAVGMAAMLLLPLLVALCVARCCCAARTSAPPHRRILAEVPPASPTSDDASDGASDGEHAALRSGARTGCSKSAVCQASHLAAPGLLVPRPPLKCAAQAFGLARMGDRWGSREYSHRTLMRH